MIFGHAPVPTGDTRIVIYAFHMPLFFMISGFLYKSISLRHEIVRCFKCLYIPYLCYVAILYPYAVWKHGDILSTQRIIELLTGSLESTSAVYSHLWFIFALMSIRIIAALFRKENTLVLCGVFLLGYRIISPYISTGRDLDIFQLQSAILCYPFFATGQIVRRYDVLQRIYNFSLISKVLLGITTLFFLIRFSVANECIGTFINDYGRELDVFYTNAILLSLLTMYIFRCFLNKPSKVVYYLSIGTLVILAFHKFLIGKITEGYGGYNVFTVFLGSIATALCFVIPIILLKRYTPFLLGKGFKLSIFNKK
jgi:fucose 4-O-acetylase-like acetyltransferase